MSTFRICAQKERVIAILSGDIDHFRWDIRPPTKAEIEKFHIKYVGKLFISALPFSKSGEPYLLSL